MVFTFCIDCEGDFVYNVNNSEFCGHLFGDGICWDMFTKPNDAQIAYDLRIYVDDDTVVIKICSE